MWFFCLYYKLHIFKKSPPRDLLSTHTISEKKGTSTNVELLKILVINALCASIFLRYSSYLSLHFLI